MSGRLGHIDGARRVGHVPRNGLRVTNYAYGFGGCTFWLDAASGLNTHSDLGAVSRWEDKIGNVVFSELTAGNQPRLRLTNADYNNHPTVEFLSGRRLIALNTSIYLNDVSILIVVCNYDTLGAGNAVIGKTQNNHHFYVGGSNSNYIGCGFFYGAYVKGGAASSAPRIIVFTRTRIFINGTVVYTGDLSPAFSQQWNLLAAFTSTSNPLLGRIAEIIVYDNYMTDDNVVEITNRLNSKYAIY